MTGVAPSRRSLRHFAASTPPETPALAPDFALGFLYVGKVVPDCRLSVNELQHMSPTQPAALLRQNADAIHRLPQFILPLLRSHLRPSMFNCSQWRS